MFIIGDFLSTLAEIINWVLTVYTWFIIIRALISWVNPDPSNPIVQFLVQTTEPFLALFRRMLPFTYRVGIDLSPVIAIVFIMFVRRYLVAVLLHCAVRLNGM